MLSVLYQEKGIIMSKTTCAYCKFCKYERRRNSFVCLNEDSKMYGKNLDSREIKTMECSDFRAFRCGDMSLKQAVKLYTGPEKVHNVMYFEILPEDRKKYGNSAEAGVYIGFRTNEDLADWQDAHSRLFMEYMKMAEADGDFEEDTDDDRPGPDKQN